MQIDITCPHCNSHFVIADVSHTSSEVSFCPFCRYALHPGKSNATDLDHTRELHTNSSSISFLQEHIPESEKILFSVGPYQILDKIGKGGMGEVFLAYDTTCGRRLALKQIRPDLIEHKHLHQRFLKEARITSQLTHPAIIPIYSIYDESNLTYYTMPFIEGKTLKLLLREARQREQRGEKLDHTTDSIPALIRIFLSICQAVAYAHSKNVLHRDLKPENIIVGKYGQIIILDWGLAKMLHSTFQEDFPETSNEKEGERTQQHLTHLGKIVGTITYMAPERALGNPANTLTDIYSLGVILYQMLTLRLPFHRNSLKEFRKNHQKEVLVDPIEVAPYRDVSRSLSLLVLKCLAQNPEQRYKTVDQLIHDLESYIEGRAEWFQIAHLDIHKKSDWEFQENVFIAEHIALIREADPANWVNLMISKTSFQETIKIDVKIRIGEKGRGVGILLNVPEGAERRHLNDGYCLWLGTESNRSTKLLRSTVEVLNAPDCFLTRNSWHDIRIEKIENKIYFYLDNQLQFSYISHIPLAGTHVGLLTRDADFTIEDFIVSVGSHNVMVHCLAVPDAFLAHNDYTTALNEYRRIGYSFPGRAEGREAMFRAGITLLEQANNTLDPVQKEQLYDQARDEFHKLYNTPGAPLEYLGKALVYQTVGDYEEETKCFELAYRRYPKHPLLPILEEQILYRLHESSRHSRKATFNFLLFVLRYLPHIATSSNSIKLLRSLEANWEPLFFVEDDSTLASSEMRAYFHYGLRLAFWLARPYALTEIIDSLIYAKDEIVHPITLANALFCLIELGCWQLAKQKIHEIRETPLCTPELDESLYLIDVAIHCHEISLGSAIEELVKKPPSTPSIEVERVVLHLMNMAIDNSKAAMVHLLVELTSDWPTTPEGALLIRCGLIWTTFLEKDLKRAGELLHAYPVELLGQETSLLHFLYGCWLDVTEGHEIASIHFAGLIEHTYPRTWNLFSHHFKGKITENQGWFRKTFPWERRQLYRQLSLYYMCLGEVDRAIQYQQKAASEKCQEES